MYTNKDINIIRGITYAFACAKDYSDPVAYRNIFDTALQEYFIRYPNFEEDDNPYQTPDFLEEE